MSIEMSSQSLSSQPITELIINLAVGCSYLLEMHRTCPLQCSAEAEYFGAQAERVPKFGRIFLFYDE